jgi:hypothetical protein
MDTVVYLDNGILFSTKKEMSHQPWKDLEEKKMHVAKWKSQSEKAGRIQIYHIL